MEKMHLENSFMAFQKELAANDRSKGTIDKYLRDVRAFFQWLQDRELSKEQALAWREHLVEKGYMPTTVNAMVSSLNAFFQFIHREDCKMKFLRIQRKVFCEPSRELGKDEYTRLLQTAERCGNDRLKLLMETICATGIRVSELKYITLEAVQKGRSVISLKGKIRTILLPHKLCVKLQKYARKQRIYSGEIFLTKNKTSLSRRQIWKEMKGICALANVDSKKVFPHNLRHLFAITFYKSYRDIVRLADILGHSNLETTRIYLISTGEEHQRQLDQLQLIS